MPPVRDPAADRAPWLPAWRTALERNADDRLVQLATVSPDGEPEVRTVVLRGVTGDGRPYLIGDARAAKHRALDAEPIAEVCAWWPRTQEQFRLRGAVRTVVGGDGPDGWAARRRDLWRDQGPQGRELFMGPQPGSPLTSDAEDAPPEGARGAVRDETSAADSETPPPWFALYVLTPSRVERLVLGPPHRREIYRHAAAGWTGGRVAP